MPTSPSPLPGAAGSGKPIRAEPARPRRRSPARPPADAAPVQVVERVALILRALAAAPAPCSLAEIAGVTGLPRTTVHRLVRALEAERLVDAGGPPAGGFVLGSEFLSPAVDVRRRLADVVHPHLETLSAAIGETVDLSLRTRGRATFIDQVAGPHRLQAVSAIGVSFPLHATANGKALLADMTDEQVSSLLPPRLEALTSFTVTDRSSLLRELARIRRSRLAWDGQEHDLGVCAVGTVLHNAVGIELAVSVPVPMVRLQQGRKRDLGQALLETRRRIEADLTVW